MSGVLYAEDFDEPLMPITSKEPLAASTTEPELIEPRFSLDELRAATAQAHEEGRDAERRAAFQSMEQQRIAALTMLGEQLSAVQTDNLQRVGQALDAIADTALSLLVAALPGLCADHAQDALRSLLHRVLPPARQLPELHIRVHPLLRAALEKETDTILDGATTRVTWTESTKLQPGDISISWQNGMALRDTAATCKEISDSVLALFSRSQASRPTEVQDGQ